MSVLLADIPEHARLMSKLRAIADVPASEADALLGLEVNVREFERGVDMVREHDRPSHSCLLLSGTVARYKTLPDGGRQIMSFNIAGDIPDLQALHLGQQDHSIGVLRPTRIAAIKHDDLRRVIYANPTVCHLLWRDTLIEGAIHREWMMAIGRLDARARIAHLFCELFLKHAAAGLTSGTSFRLQLTQTELGDALGLTPVHVNRVLQELRAERLIQLDRSDLTVLDYDRLQDAGAFDPTYLHMKIPELG